MLNPSRIRPPAVAGLFYPADAAVLREEVESFLAAAPTCPDEAVALVAPHAGYVYSGPVAGSAFACLAGRADGVSHVIVVGPSHFVAFDGVATSGAEGFETPLGVVPVHAEAERWLSGCRGVAEIPAAHRREHCLEVELPFLQVLLGEFRLTPLVVGRMSGDELGALLDELSGEPGTLIVVSSDLSHYHRYETAQRIDAETCRVIETLERDLAPEEACGAMAFNGLRWLARRRGLRVRTLDLRNSGDTAGPRDQVVGYGAWSLVAAA